MDDTLLFIVFVAIVGGIAYFVKSRKPGRFRGVARRVDEGIRQQAARAALDRKRRRTRIRYLGRQLQISLIQLRAAPDFRRAASWARHSKDVPIAFRQRQFRRFRDQLVEHVAARTAAGENRQRLKESLTELVRGLGVKPFEADYILREGLQLVPRPARPVPLTFQQRAQLLQREHDQRLASITSLENVNDEIREQMQEAEEQRFAEAMLELGDPDQRQAS